jgi:hypothetical protein
VRTTRTKPDLSDGWSFPLTPAEVDDYFAQVGFVSWRTTNSKQTGEWGTTPEVLFNLSWHPGISRPQPILTIRALPSPHQAEVRDWIDHVVAPELRAWLEALPTRSTTWLEHAHVVSWKWQPADATS